MSIILFLTLLLLALGWGENFLHQRRLKNIPIRIHVNGTRGKSTTTRLIAGVCREAGYRVVAKTTGTAAQLIYEDGTEMPILRKRAPTILEQIKIVREAVGRRADVLVIECMAINPEIQWVAEHRLIRSTIGVITNARPDHQDQMGETRQDVAEALSFTIPGQAHLVVGDEDFFDFFQSKAQKLGTQTLLADASVIDPQKLDGFPYLMFANNVACALRVAEILGISQPVAWAGMEGATPDPGATEISSLAKAGRSLYFVNALAANDLMSTIMVWEKWRALAEKLSLADLPVVGLLHNRADRSFRVDELTQIATSHLSLGTLWLTGDLMPVTRRYLKKHGFDLNKVKSKEKRLTPEDIVNDVLDHNGSAVLFAYGNTKGFGQELADYFDRNGERVTDGLRSDWVGSGF